MKQIGSYKLTDVVLLLQQLKPNYVSIEEKEKLIQSGQKHYSELISEEFVPDEHYMNLYHNALDMFKERYAKDILKISRQIQHDYQNRPVVLVSLVRAGLPVGVLLHRALKDLGLTSYHYGVSIIRDKGLDTKAMTHILTQHGNQNIIFVDGWTGKGAIYNQLKTSCHELGIPLKFATLADIIGVADYTGSHEDWLIPSGILNSIVSGLISRTIITSTGFHGCVVYDHLKEHDQTYEFIEIIDSIRKRLQAKSACKLSEIHDVIAKIKSKYNVSDINHIKPSLAEATRAVLRRKPERILLRSSESPNTVLIRYLAKEQNIEIEVVGDLIKPYEAVTIIKKS